MFDNGDFFLGYMMGSSENNNSSGGGDGSGIIAFLGVIGGLVLEAIFLTMFDTDAISEIPAFLLALGWIFCSCIIFYLISKIKK